MSKKASGAAGRKKRNDEREQDKKAATEASKIFSAFLTPKPLENVANHPVIPLETSKTPIVALPPSSFDNIPINLSCQRDDTIESIREARDIGFLKFNPLTKQPELSKTDIEELAKLGWKSLQNENGPFKSINGRSPTKNWFYTTVGNNGLQICRSYLLYSPSKGALYCFCCLLFLNETVVSSLATTEGFQNYKKPEKLKIHENSKGHRNNFI